MKHLALFLSLAILAFGQEAPSAVGNEQPLVAKPARDIFDFATLIYNTAADEKDPEKRKEGFRQAAKKFDAFLRSYPKDEKALDSWYFLGLCYRQIGEDKASRQCFETVATSWTEGKFVEASALYLASDDYGAAQWASAAKWFEITAKVTKDKKIRQESLYRRFLCFSKMEDSTGTLLALKEVLKDEDTPFAETARLALARLYRSSEVLREAHDQYVILSNSSKKEVRSEAILQAALTADEMKDPKLAKIWFGKALKEDGLKEYRGQTQIALMNLHYSSKEWTEVIDTFKDGDHPLSKENDLQRLIMAAKSYEALGKDDEVLKLYARISKLSPGSATSLQAAYRVLVQEHSKKSPSFAQSAESFLATYGVEHAKDTKIQSARLLIAEHYYGIKDHKKAIEHYRNLDLSLIDSTNRLGVRYHVAKTQLALKDEGGSLAAIAAFIKEYPDSKQATQLRLDRAELLTAKGKEAGAISDYNAVLNATGDQELKRIILLRLSAVYQEKEDWIKFVSMQEKLLLIPDLDPKTAASANFWLGWNEFRLKKVETALPFLIKARELDSKAFAPKVGPLLIRAAYQAENTALLENEITIMRAADQQAPVPSPMLIWLGATLSKDGHHDRAWPLLEEGLKDRSKPIANLIWRLFAQSSLALKKNSSVVQASDEILTTESHPYRKAEALYFKSQGLTSLNKFNEARQSASDALDLRPQGELDIQLRLHAGDIDMADKKPGDAIRHYSVVETLYAKSPEDKALARQKVTDALKAIGTPEALEKLKKYQ